MKTYKKMPKIVSRTEKSDTLFSLSFSFFFGIINQSRWSYRTGVRLKFNQSSGVVAIESETGHDGIILGSPQWVDRPVTMMLIIRPLI